MGAYDARSQPLSIHAAVIFPASARSVTPGFTALIIARCATMDASAAFFSSAISPSSFTTRNSAVSAVTSRAESLASIPSVALVKPTSAFACGASGCAQMFRASRRSPSISRFNTPTSSVIGCTASTPAASATPGEAASSFAPVYFSMRRSRVGKNRISLYSRAAGAPAV